jgi:hypothetical protein
MALHPVDEPGQRAAEPSCLTPPQLSAARPGSPPSAATAAFDTCSLIGHPTSMDQVVRARGGGHADDPVTCGLRPSRQVLDKRTYRRFPFTSRSRRVTAAQLSASAVGLGVHASSAWRRSVPGEGVGPMRVTWRRPRYTRRRCRWRAGPGCRGPGRTALWFSGQHGTRFLDVAQGDPGVERGGDERVPQRVGRDGLGDPGAAGGLADDPSGAVPVQPPPVRGQEHRAAGALADGKAWVILRSPLKADERATATTPMICTR